MLLVLTSIFLELLGCRMVGALQTPFNKFNPKQLGSAVILSWYDASTISGNDGDAVSSWTDSSGNGRTLSQGVGALQPTLKKGANGLNGKNVVLFDGTDTLTTGTQYLNTANKHTCFAVIKQTTVADHEIFGNDTAGNGFNWRFRNNGGTQQLRIVRGQVVADWNTGIGADTWAYYTLITRCTTGAAGTSTQRVNGSDISTSGSATCTGSPAGNVHIGSLAGATEFLVGALAESIICEGELTALQYTQVEAYLKQKYGL